MDAPTQRFPKLNTKKIIKFVVIFCVALIFTELVAVYCFVAKAMGDFDFLSRAVLHPRSVAKEAYEIEPVAGIRKNSFFIPCSDGSKMHAWYFKKPDSDMLLIANHGAGGNIITRTYIAQSAAKSNYSTLLYDYRGYAWSTGKCNLDSILDDGLTVYDYARKELGYSADKIVECGESIGTAVACQTAASRPCAGLIMLSGLTQLPTPVRHIFPILSLFPDMFYAKNRIDNIATIKGIHVPVLFVHGKKDEQVPYQCSQQMYAVAPEPKKLVLLPNSAHDDVGRKDADQFQEAITSFLSLCRKQ